MLLQVLHAKGKSIFSKHLLCRRRLFYHNSFPFRWLVAANLAVKNDRHIRCRFLAAGRLKQACLHHASGSVFPQHDPAPSFCRHRSLPVMIIHQMLQNVKQAAAPEADASGKAPPCINSKAHRAVRRALFMPHAAGITGNRQCDCGLLQKGAPHPAL